MPLIESLRKRWIEEAPFRSFYSYPYINNDGLLLGAGTVLATMRRSQTGVATLTISGNEEKIFALLSLGYRQHLSIDLLRFIKRASLQWAKGEPALAQFELAYARLPRFESKADAQWLFYMDGLIQFGVSPRFLMRAVGLGIRELDLLKYAADEPREPAGHGRESGEWTSSDIEVAQNSRWPGDSRRFLPVGGSSVNGGAPVGEAPTTDGAIGVGKYAGQSIPARSPARDFTPQEREEINKIGADTGCHTCGTKSAGTSSGNFIPDHQPPSALNSSSAPQRLYPQCINCSREQGLGIARQLQQRKP